MRLPDELIPLQTDDLIAKLSQLTQQQVNGIARIVASGYLTETPICPRDLLVGDNPICSPQMFYRPGRWSDDDQRWQISPGWTRQPAFIEALALAKRLALRYSTDEEYTAIRTASRHARMASPNIMQEMIAIARGIPTIVSIPSADHTESTESTESTDKDAFSVEIDRKSQVTAATLVLKHATLDAIPSDDGDNPEADWWKAAEEDAA